MRIAHISDLHLSPAHNRSNIRRTKELLDWIGRLGVDHVVITGDIVADARREDLLVARNLLQSHGLLDSRLLSVVPGNHDVYGGVHTAEDLLKFPRRCRMTDVRKTVEHFRDAFHEAFEGTQSASGDAPFPYVKPVGDLLIIGLNSVASYSAMKNPVGSNGEIDRHQLQCLDRLLSFSGSRESRRIVLIHHHFNKMRHRTDGTMQGIWKAFERRTMKLHGTRALLNLFRRHGVDVVLHGHYHQNSKYTRGGIRFLNGGGSILTPGSSGYHLNLIRVDRMEIRVQQFELPLLPEDRRVRVNGDAALSTVEAA